MENYIFAITELVITGNADAVEIIIDRGLKKFSKFANGEKLKYKNNLELNLLTVDIFKENKKIEYNYLIQNTVVDYTLNSIEAYSEKYLESIKADENVFIAAIIKKLICWNDDFVGVFYSILRMFSLENYTNSIYQNIYKNIKIGFGERNFNCSYGVKFKLILLICKYKSIESEIFKDIAFNISKTKIENFITEIEEINYEKYEIYIKTIFEEEITENIFNDNKLNLSKLFKDIG